MRPNNKVIASAALLLLLLFWSQEGGKGEKPSEGGSESDESDEERSYFLTLGDRNGLVISEARGSLKEAQEIADALTLKGQSWMSVRGPGRPQRFLVWSVLGPKKDMTDFREHAQVVIEYAGSLDVGQVSGGKG